MEGEVWVLSEEEDEALAYRASGTEDTALLGRELRGHSGCVSVIESMRDSRRRRGQEKQSKIRWGVADV